MPKLCSCWRKHPGSWSWYSRRSTEAKKWLLPLTLATMFLGKLQGWTSMRRLCRSPSKTRTCERSGTRLRQRPRTRWWTRHCPPRCPPTTPTHCALAPTYSTPPALRLGFEIGDLNPPVPAPRYKRKLITTEDSKHTSIMQNTSVNEQTVNLMPPPRRKNKPQTYQQINTLLFTLEDIESSIFQKDIEKGNRVKRLLDCSAATEKKNTFSNPNHTVWKDVDIFEESDSHTDNLFLKEIVVKGIELASEAEELQEDSQVEKHLELDKVIMALDNITSNEPEEYVAFEESRASHIFENCIEDRVLDNPLETAEDSPRTSSVEQETQNYIEDEDSEENRVFSSFSENSATIVGVFYKPEYSSLGELSREALASQTTRSELDSVFRLSSRVDDGNKTAIIVPMCGSKKENNNIITKDSEEDDSGVYFSDTKSPSHRGINLETKVPDVEEDSKATNTENELDLHKTFSCNNGDTFDNKTTEDLGPQNYRKMLDQFEAQTVNAFHEKIVTSLSLNGEEINKNKVVEDWLDSGEYLSKKKNSSFSQYLKNMLEPESSAGSPSPYPLSMLDEDDRSDNFSDDLRGSKEVEEVVNRNSSLQASTVSSSFTHTHESRSVAPSNNIGFIVDMNNVNNHNVNNDCIKVTSDNSEFISSSDKFITNKADFEFSREQSYFDPALINSDCNVLPEQGFDLQTFVPQLVKLEDDSDDDDYNNNEEQDNEFNRNTTSRVVLCSPATQNAILFPNFNKHGVVNSLVAYFEAINRQEVESIYENGCSPEEELENASKQRCSDNLDFGEYNKLEKLNLLNSLSLDKEPTDMNSTGSVFEDLAKNEDVLEKQEMMNDQFNVEEDNVNTVASSPTRKSAESEGMLQDSLGFSAADKKIKYIAGLSFEDFQETVGTVCDQEIQGATCDMTSDMLNVDYKMAIVEKCGEEQKWPIVTVSDEIADKSFLTESTSPEAFIYDNNVEISFEVQNEEEINNQSCLDEEFHNFSDILSDDIRKCSESLECDNDSEENDMGETEKIDPTASCLFKPTRIPVIVLSETDVRLSPVGSIELHPTEGNLQNKNSDTTSEISESKSDEEVGTLSSYNQISDECVTFPPNVIDIALEKNWGSIGMKIKGDGKQVVVSEILSGGSADCSGLVFKGWIDVRAMSEEMEIFC
uniref:PDZ domain-containing protein n=1 Tax=Graphocephala atropunctata TaxID=36148 RepID=A0A1B6L9I1_9HEMI